MAARPETMKFTVLASTDNGIMKIYLLTDNIRLTMNVTVIELFLRRMSKISIMTGFNVNIPQRSVETTDIGKHISGRWRR